MNDYLGCWFSRTGNFNRPLIRFEFKNMSLLGVKVIIYMDIFEIMLPYYPELEA